MCHWTSWPAHAAAVVTAAVAAVVLVPPPWASPGQPAVPTLVESEAESSRLDAAREEFAAGAAFSRTAARDLAAGRVALRDAAAAVTAVCSRNRVLGPAVNPDHLALTPEAQFAAFLVCRVWDDLAAEPDRRPVTRRLVAEFRAAYGEPAHAATVAIGWRLPVIAAAAAEEPG